MLSGLLGRGAALQQAAVRGADGVEEAGHHLRQRGAGAAQHAPPGRAQRSLWGLQAAPQHVLHQRVQPAAQRVRLRAGQAGGCAAARGCGGLAQQRDGRLQLGGGRGGAGGALRGAEEGVAQRLAAGGPLAGPLRSERQRQRHKVLQRTLAALGQHQRLVAARLQAPPRRLPGVQLAREELKRHDAHRPHVAGARPQRLVPVQAARLGRAVASHGRAAAPGGGGDLHGVQLARQHGCDAKVAERQAAVILPEDVLGLDVTVADAPRVRVGQRLQQLPEHAAHGCPVASAQGTPALLQLVHPAAQRAAPVEGLHAVGGAILPPGTLQRRHQRVAKAHQPAQLSHEAGVRVGELLEHAVGRLGLANLLDAGHDGAGSEPQGLHLLNLVAADERHRRADDGIGAAGEGHGQAGGASLAGKLREALAHGCRAQERLLTADVRLDGGHSGADGRNRAHVLVLLHCAVGALQLYGLFALVLEVLQLHPRLVAALLGTRQRVTRSASQRALLLQRAQAVQVRVAHNRQSLSHAGIPLGRLCGQAAAHGRSRARRARDGIVHRHLQRLQDGSLLGQALQQLRGHSLRALLCGQQARRHVLGDLRNPHRSGREVLEGVPSGDGHNVGPAHGRIDAADVCQHLVDGRRAGALATSQLAQQARSLSETGAVGLFCTVTLRCSERHLVFRRAGLHLAALGVAQLGERASGGVAGCVGGLHALCEPGDLLARRLDRRQRAQQLQLRRHRAPGGVEAQALPHRVRGWRQRLQRRRP